MRTAGKNGTDLNLLKRSALLVHAFLHDQLCTFRRYHMVLLHKDISLCIQNILAQIPPGNTLFQALNLFVSVHECFHIHPRNLLTRLHAVNLMDDQLLGDIYKTSCKISRIGCTKCRI